MTLRLPASTSTRRREKEIESERGRLQEMGKKEKWKFPAISLCDPAGREKHAVAADLDGTLLVGRSSFPYFMLLAIEAGGFLRGILLLLSSPIILFLYRLISESAGIHLLIFISIAGLKIDRIRAASATVLPRFYAADVRSDAWKAFSACKRRRVVVTANPTIMVEPFVKRWLGGDKVLGTELEVDLRTGRATGFVSGPGVLVAEKKRDAILREFKDADFPELGLGDRETDHDFMALCEEGYMVPPDKTAERVPREQLPGSALSFTGGRFVRRPDPPTALLIFLWLPLGSLLSLLRYLLLTTLPRRHLRFWLSLSGVNLTVLGNPPPPRSLLVSNRRNPLDLAAITAALHGDTDAVVFPEETTCREPFLLKFSPLFAGLSSEIVPVGIKVKEEIFYGTSSEGSSSFVDVFFFLMNPRPGYEITFLERLPEGWTSRGGRAKEEVAGYVQRLLGKSLGFHCTDFTLEEKLQQLKSQGYKKVQR